MINQPNPKVDTYLLEGCGRCERGGTPRCSVNRWQSELKLLRQIAIDCALTEEIKWGVPCYTYEGRNVLLVSALLEYCAISFLKGALLSDPHHVLEKPGEILRRQGCFASLRCNRLFS